MKEPILDRFSRSLIQHAWIVLAVSVVIAGAFASQIPKLKADFTPSDLFASFEDQEKVAATFRDTFGNTDNVVLVLLEGDDVLDAPSLTATAGLVDALRSLDDVERTEALTTMWVREGSARTSQPSTESSASVTDAYFDLYDLSAGLTRSASGGGGEAEEPGESHESADSEPSNAESIAPGQPAQNVDGEPIANGTPDTKSAAEREAGVVPIVSSPPVSEAQAERIRDLIQDRGLVRGRLVSDDSTLSAIAVFLKNDRLKNDQIAQSMAKIEAAVHSVEVPDGERVLLGGLPYIRKTVVDNLRQDQAILLPASIVVSLLILFIAFRWWAAMALPTLAVGFSAITLVGGMALVGEPFNILNNIIPTLVVVIGISDSIHVINRYRDGVGAGLDRRRSAVDALRTMTVACFLTSFTTAVGFASLGISETAILRHFGITAAIGVMIAYFMTITLVPASLSLVPAPKRASVQQDHGTMETIIERVTRFVVHHRWPVIAVATVVLAGSVAIGRTIVVDSAVLDQVNPHSQVYKTTRLIEKKLGGIRPLEFMIRADDPFSLTKPEVVRATKELIDWGREQQGVLGTLSFADFLRQARQVATGIRDDGGPLDDSAQNKALYELLQRQGKHNPLANYLVDDGRVGRVTLTVRDMGARQTNELITKAEAKVHELFDPIDGVSVEITGDAFSSSRGLDAVIGDLIASLSTAVVIIFLFLTLLFRSLKLGLLSIPPNLLPLGTTLGYMTLRGVPLNTATAIIFSISIGLAVDGTIHYLARFREELREDNDVDEALIRAARGTGKAILVTCVALIVGFGVMLVSQFVPIRRFGELIAVTVFGMLLSTVLVLPALIRVGYRNHAKDEETSPS